MSEVETLLWIAAIFVPAAIYLGVIWACDG